MSIHLAFELGKKDWEKSVFLVLSSLCVSWPGYKEKKTKMTSSDIGTCPAQPNGRTNGRTDGRKKGVKKIFCVFLLPLAVSGR
jgi:hypothetical protein